jgi:hypothetical protein
MDLIKLLLSGTVSRWFLPAVWGYLVYLAAARIEPKLSIAFLRDCTLFLEEKQYTRYLGTLPELTSRSFDWFFGEKHASFKCLRRSTLLSMLAVGAAICASAIFNPKGTYDWLIPLLSMGWYGILVIITVWVLCSIVPAYFLLGKTRFVIWTLRHARVGLKELALIVLADFAIGNWVFLTIASLAPSMAAVGIVVYQGKTPADSSALAMVMGGGLVAIMLFLAGGLVLIPTGQLYFSIPIGDLFWASMAPSLILWGYVLASLLSRFLVAASPLFGKLTYLLDVERHPVQSIGIVAAVMTTLLSFVCVAIGSLFTT